MPDLRDVALDDCTRTWWLRRRMAVLNCGWCRPHRGENNKNYRVHGRAKPRYKDIDRTSIRK